MLAPIGDKVFYAKFYVHILEFSSILRVMLKLCALPAELWQLPLSLSSPFSNVCMCSPLSFRIDVDVLLGEPIQAEISAHTGLELAYDSLTTLSLGKFAWKG